MAVYFPSLDDFYLVVRVQTSVVLASIEEAASVMDSACPVVLLVVFEEVVVQESSSMELLLLLELFCRILNFNRVVRICCFSGYLSLV